MQNHVFFSRFAELTEQEALDLACGVEQIQNGVLREDFVTKFQKVENFEATLEFSVREIFDDETRRKKKEAKELEKERKKEARERRIAMYGSSKKKKDELWASSCNKLLKIVVTFFWSGCVEGGGRGEHTIYATLHEGPANKICL